MFKGLTTLQWYAAAFAHPETLVLMASDKKIVRFHVVVSGNPILQWTLGSVNQQFFLY